MPDEEPAVEVPESDAAAGERPESVVTEETYDEVEELLGGLAKPAIVVVVVAVLAAFFVYLGRQAARVNRPASSSPEPGAAGGRDDR